MILEYDNMIIVWVCFNADRMKENQTIFCFSLEISTLRFTNFNELCLEFCQIIKNTWHGKKTELSFFIIKFLQLVFFKLNLMQTDLVCNIYNISRYTGMWRFFIVSLSKMFI